MFTLKQLMASATALKRKYPNDFLYSARLKILYYLTVCGVATSVALYFFLAYFFRHFAEIVTEVPLRTPYDLLTQNLYWQLLGVVAFITICNAICAYFIVKVLLAQTSEAFNLQKRFVSGIAHELRTPLSVLRINNELARLSQHKDSAFIELFDENIADIDRINETLNALLHYDRLLSSQSIQFETISLKKILIVVSSRLAEIAKQKNINLLITTTGADEIVGNQTALEQAFFNIIENAITYSPQDSDIIITSTEQAHTVIVSIKDVGNGIPQKDLPHIFEPFYRNEKTGKLSGIGIGLAIVEQIIRLHRGHISVVSESGLGTEFTITIPLLPQSRS